MERIRNIAEAIRILRLLSISGMVFNSYMIWYVLDWVTGSNPASIGEGVAITGIIGALSLNYRFLFQFASSGKLNSEMTKGE